MMCDCVGCELHEAATGERKSWENQIAAVGNASFRTHASSNGKLQLQ